MILIDYNGIAIANMYASVNRGEPLTEDFLRHMILNTLRMYNMKFKANYGSIVVCADEGGHWRKKYFEHYKANRKTSREESDLDWDFIFDIINKVKDEIKENLPYKVISIRGCEADDIIATLVETTQEFGNYEKVMIVSNDKDFLQLQQYENVEQFAPVKKKLLKEPNPRTYLFEHICRGDGGDGVPNVLSNDDTFVSGGRQSQLRQTKIDNWIKLEESELKESMGEEIYRNYQRNKLMIDLSQVPSDVKQEIINTYESQEVTPNNKLLPYLVKNRCRLLIGSAGEFF